MIRVSPSTTDRAMAWRVRDTLARHPLLGGALAQVQINACRQVVVLEGWVLDEGLYKLALQLATQAAGSRPVHERLRTRHGSRSAESIS